MFAKTKYVIRVGWKMFTPNTEVELLRVDDPRVQAAFPKIAYNAESTYIAVQFPGLDHATLIHETQICNAYEKREHDAGDDPLRSELPDHQRSGFDNKFCC